MTTLSRHFPFLEQFTARLAPLAQLALRFALAIPFFRSGLTRWEGFGRISDSTLYLFREEFRLHLFGAEVPYPAPALFAHGAAIAELLLPMLLVLGLGTRVAAAGLLAMTCIIQLTIPDGWANFHLPWAAMALSLVAFGAGPLSLDRVFWKRRMI